MKYFAVLLPMLDEEKSKKWRPDHLDFLRQKSEEGKIFAKGRFADGAGGLIIYKGKDLAGVEETVKKDPYIIHGARTFEIHEWEMTLEE
ncbi:YciI family protein [Virgibacillus sp. YIM 98842]|uniref:YciI family protein n=1 Tax=Virgibacillus sp. YIM 98842 TaxID=2663533 RepID=UPI0013DA752B|nr:YciI family protein [Virgibacillus sp. YIM 98842]